MTGFGVAEGEMAGARISVELKSVNHRFFNPSIKLPGPFARWEGDVREVLRQTLARGHITAMVRYDRDAAAAAGIDDVAFASAVERLRALQAKHRVDGIVDIGAVLRIPGVFAQQSDDGFGESPDALLDLVRKAASALARTREDEGARLGTIISERLDVVAGALARIAARAPERIAAHRDKLRASIQELAAGVAVDEQRLAQEVAILAERADVGEELDRFASHLTAFRNTLRAQEGEPVGKRLGFLLQEMLREANTTGSKANDAAMQMDVVTVKEELERIREQVENLE
jgi:uncharacterized protein (TIGR00255 family)